MPDSQIDTCLLRHCVARWQVGDRAAADNLLLDLARSFRAEKFTHPPSPQSPDESHGSDLTELPGPNADHSDLDLWCRFHEAVEQLPTEEREVLGLVFYHGWTQTQVAELFQVDERTIRRRWRSICLHLHVLVGAEMPQP